MTDKLLFVHADYFGMSHSENRATIDAFGIGLVNSGSVMVPCPWIGEVLFQAQLNPNLDLGIHLMLTSEWKYYTWSHIVPYSEVPSLEDNNSFFYDN